MSKPRKPVVLISPCEEKLDKQDRYLWVVRYFTVGWSKWQGAYTFRLVDTHPIAYINYSAAEKATYRIAAKRGLMILSNVENNRTTFDIERSITYWEKIVDQLIECPCEHHQKLANEILQQAIGVRNALEVIGVDQYPVPALQAG